MDLGLTWNVKSFLGPNSTLSNSSSLKFMGANPVPCILGWIYGVWGNLSCDVSKSKKKLQQNPRSNPTTNHSWFQVPAISSNLEGRDNCWAQWHRHQCLHQIGRISTGECGDDANEVMYLRCRILTPFRNSEILQPNGCSKRKKELQQKKSAANWPQRITSLDREQKTLQPATSDRNAAIHWEPT